MTNDPLPAEHLSPLATLADEVLARVGYEMAAATDAIDDAVPGHGGLFDPGTTPDELRCAFERLLASELTRPPASHAKPIHDQFHARKRATNRGEHP